jgi:hypothetical protein
MMESRTRRSFPSNKGIYDDIAYQQPKAAKAAAKTGYWTIEVIDARSAARRWLTKQRCDLIDSRAVPLAVHRDGGAFRRLSNCVYLQVKVRPCRLQRLVSHSCRNHCAASAGFGEARAECAPKVMKP